MFKKNVSSVVPSWYNRWLLGGLFLLITMILLGGATRLYQAGLSIVQWELFQGIFPPFNELKWQIYFNLYQKSPEYRHFHSWMRLENFKVIFWFEYSHRLLGRIIGLWFLIPTVKIGLLTNFPKEIKKNLVGINALIIVQGIVGWYMVKSGLGKNAMVSHYRLALHLTLAFILIGWVTKLLIEEYKCILNIQSSKKPLYGLVFLFIVTGLYGVFVAGLKAGLIYNTFPLMEGQFFPSDGWFYSPMLSNVLKNPSLVQFIHRILGMVMLIGSWLTFFYYRTKTNHRDFLTIAGLCTLQATLGIFCLLTQLNFWIALAHQANAIVIWITLIKMLVSLRKLDSLMKR